MKRFLHTMAEAAAFMYGAAMLLALYIFGAIMMYGASYRAGYVILFAIVIAVPLLVGVAYAVKGIAKAILRARKPKRLGVIPSHVIVRALCVTK